MENLLLAFNFLLEDINIINMKYLYILTTFLFTISCLPSNKLDDSNQKILSEIIKEHDVLMEKMGEIKKLENDIKSTLSEDSLSEKLVSSLKSSNKMMMKFMQDFSDEFPYDKYPMNSKDNKGDDELLKDVNGIELPVEKDYAYSSWAYYIIKVKEKEFGINRNKLYSELTKKEREIRDLLINTMKKYNFEVYQYEWWHFNYNDCNSKILNYSFEELDSLLF